MLNKYHSQEPIITLHCHDHLLSLANQVPLIIGVDEVGRGCLFGHMTVGACILSPDWAVSLKGNISALKDTPLTKLNDSKKLSEKTREQLDTTIKQHASYVLVDIPASVIDRINIHQATLLGMKTAITALLDSHKLTTDKVQILIDGNQAPILDSHRLYQKHIHTIIKGDSAHASIACASILAKVARDCAMMEYAKLYPEFGLDKHKGYPTVAHKKALAQFGVLPEHRRSYAPIMQALQA